MNKDPSKHNIRKSILRPSIPLVLFLKFHLYLQYKYQVDSPFNLPLKVAFLHFEKECKALTNSGINLPMYISLKGIKNSGSLYMAIGKTCVSEESFIEVPPEVFVLYRLAI